MNPAGGDNIVDAVRRQGVTLGHALGQVETNARTLQAVGAMAEEAHRLVTAVTEHTRLVEPERFFREPDRLDSFVNHLRLKYELEAGRFPSERAKVLHCLSCMGGTAYEWAIAEFHCGADCCQTFKKFTEELTLMFNPASLPCSVEMVPLNTGGADRVRLRSGVSDTGGQVRLPGECLV